MVEVIQLPTNTARMLNDARSLLDVYRPRNSDGRYNTAIDKYTKLYKSGLESLLAEAAQTASDVHSILDRLGHFVHTGVNMNRTTEVLLAVAAGVAIIVGAVYIGTHMNVSCFNWFGLAKGCVTSVH